MDILGDTRIDWLKYRWYFILISFVVFSLGALDAYRKGGLRYGIDFSFMMRDMDLGYRVAGIMYATWNVGTLITAFIAGIAISMVIAIFPTRKVLKMEVAEALHHQ